VLSTYWRFWVWVKVCGVWVVGAREKGRGNEIWIFPWSPNLLPTLCGAYFPMLQFCHTHDTNIKWASIQTSLLNHF